MRFIRLHHVLSNIISPVQGAFVRNRSIIDNIVVCQGLARNYHRDSGVPRCLMKLDLRKAYGTLDWDFLKDVLVGLNFPDKFIQLVMECIYTAKLSLNINQWQPSWFFLE